MFRSRWQARQRASAADFRLSSPFLTEIPGAEFRQNGAFVQDAITLTAVADERQRALWQDCRLLVVPPVSIRSRSARRPSGDRRPFDGLGRLRLARLPIRQLKPTFRDALTLALAVYPEASVDLEGNGLVLHPSPPAVTALKLNGSD
jgi:hypothetical protein